MGSIKPKLKLIYILSGIGRTGSTLLDLLIGSNEGFFSMGEMVNFWYAQRPRNITAWKCGCGALLKECPFWKEVKEMVGIRDLELAPEEIHKAIRTIRLRDSILFLLFRIGKFEKKKKSLRNFVDLYIYIPYIKLCKEHLERKYWLIPRKICLIYFCCLTLPCLI